MIDPTATDDPTKDKKLCLVCRQWALPFNMFGSEYCDRCGARLRR